MKLWPNTELTYQTIVRNNGVLATPTTITFKWKLGRDGPWQSATPVALSIGVYAAYITPTYGGPLYWSWRTTGPAIMEEGMTMIEDSQFSTIPGTYDYGWGYGGYW